jgi:hypothetical protein
MVTHGVRVVLMGGPADGLESGFLCPDSGPGLSRGWLIARFRGETYSPQWGIEFGYLSPSLKPKPVRSYCYVYRLVGSTRRRATEYRYKYEHRVPTALRAVA